MKRKIFLGSVIVLCICAACVIAYRAAYEAGQNMLLESAYYFEGEITDIFVSNNGLVVKPQEREEPFVVYIGARTVIVHQKGMVVDAQALSVGQWCGLYVEPNSLDSVLRGETITNCYRIVIL